MQIRHQKCRQTHFHHLKKKKKKPLKYNNKNEQVSGSQSKSLRKKSAGRLIISTK